MEVKTQKIGKISLGVAVICLIAVGVIAAVFFTEDAATGRTLTTGIIKAPNKDFDHKGSEAFTSLQTVNDAYLAGSSSERPLAEFYSRRQYPGSPPFIPHPVKLGFGADQACLSCHEKGGWVAEWQRHTPVTPHPENSMCRQCHVLPVTDKLFVESNWQSVARPRLGAAQLPGSPPPFPHDLQMRENCIACHTGPGAVTEIRSNHAIRGACRQCHLPLTDAQAFVRKP